MKAWMLASSFTFTWYSVLFTKRNGLMTLPLNIFSRKRSERRKMAKRLHKEKGCVYELCVPVLSTQGRWTQIVSGKLRQLCRTTMFDLRVQQIYLRHTRFEEKRVHSLKVCFWGCHVIAATEVKKLRGSLRLNNSEEAQPPYT